MQTATQPLPLTLQRCRDGDPRALEELCSTYQGQVFRLALSILDDGRAPGVAEEAEEVTQDVLLAMLAALEGYQGEAAFSTWLYRITVNTCHSRLRKRASLGRKIAALINRFILEHAGQEQLEEDVLQNEQKAMLWRAIQALDEKQRLPLVLHYYQDLAVSEIAAVLNIPTGTVLSRLHTARERLRASLPAGFDQPAGAGNHSRDDQRSRTK